MILNNFRTVSLPIVSKRLILSEPVPNPKNIRSYLSAVRASLSVLKPWVLWSHGVFNEQTAEDYLAACQRNWIYRTNNDIGLVLWITTRQEIFVGCVIIWNINWQIPKFELGYWVNQMQAGQGFISEAVDVVTRFLFNQWRAARVEIHCEMGNSRSIAIPERLGFLREGVFKHSTRNVLDNHLADVVVFGCTSLEQLVLKDTI